MSGDELDAFLTEQHTCRVGTSGPDGPHVTPLWFVWLEGRLWLYSLSRSQRWTDVVRDPRVAVAVDAGEQYLDLRGAELSGRAEVVGEVPRTGAPLSDTDAGLEAVERAFAAKYFGAGTEMGWDGKHGWLRVTPTKIVSWDFRKLG